MEFKMNTVKVGRIVEGTVFQVTDDVCYVDLQAFADGIIYKNGLSFTPIDSCKEVVKEGDVLNFKVTKIDHDNQRILLSRLDMLRDEKRTKFDEETKNNERIKAKVKQVVRGNKGLVLRYNDIEMFMPASQIDTKRVNPEDFKGQTLECVVIENDDKRIVVSRRKVLEQDFRKARKEAIESINIGDKIEGTVTKVMDFGAFVSLGMTEGLLHKSQISHHRVNKATEAVKEGDKFTVEVISKEKNKIGLSVKSMLETPWQIFAKTNKVGDEVTGKIVRKMATGMLVEIARDVAGMINSKDYSWDPRQNLAGEVQVGDELTVKILTLDVEKRRMALSKKHLEYNPWNDVSVKVGEEISGEIEELQTRGALVKVQGVKAFLPIQEVSNDRIREMGDAVKVGEVINGVVLEVDKRNWRMKISMKALVNQKERAIFEKYKEEEKQVKKQTLGDLFKDKFDEFK
jgi:small subunit ribosomal protein S1